jgi:hypothetical protein
VVTKTCIFWDITACLFSMDCTAIYPIIQLLYICSLFNDVFQ